ncbi:MAG TPA: biopolymer transporter ExbD [Arenimonas sp.]|nr:biopolymer transporter ExbD [Arenimonas sp.]
MRLQSGRLQEEPEINLVSLIDVVFCLLIFLVVTTTFDHRAALKLSLPTAQATTKVQAAEPLLLVVDADGRYYIGSNEVLKQDVDSLRQALAQAVGDDRERPVLLRGDARAPYQAMITAMDALGQLGLSNVNLATSPEAKP